MDENSKLPMRNTGANTAAGKESEKALDDLVSRALAYRTGNELRELFEFTRRFPHLAPFNAMLLHVQNRGIRYALRAPKWEREYRRRVRPAARPYVILQNFGPVQFVFDLSDTEPINPAEDLVPEIVKNPFPAKGEPPANASPNIIRACAQLGIQIETRDFATNLAGQAQRIKGAYEFHVALNLKHTPAQQLGTLAHELAHIFCGHLGETEDGFWPDRPYEPEAVQEFEAEAVAYLVTDRLHLDIGSVQYLAGYLNDGQALPNYSLDAVLKAGWKIEEMVAGHFRPKRKPNQTAGGNR